MTKGIDETVRISRKTVRISQKKKRRGVKVQDSRRTAPQLLFVSKTTWFYTKFQKKLNKLSFLPNNCINGGKVCKSNWAFLGCRSSRSSSARLIVCHRVPTVSDVVITQMKEKTSLKTSKHLPWRTTAQGIRIFCHAVAKNCHAFQEKQRPQ